MMPKCCDYCNKDYDFRTDASGYCITHKKNFCWQCAHEKGCDVPGERCRRVFITNPQYGEWNLNIGAYLLLESIL